MGKMNPNKQKILELIAPGLFVVAFRRKAKIDEAGRLETPKSSEYVDEEMMKPPV